MRTADGWFKSSHSGNGGNGIEVIPADFGDAVIVRETQDQLNPGVYLSIEKWKAVLAAVKAREIMPIPLRGGILRLSFSDWEPSRALFMTEGSWAAFCQGADDGQFDDIFTPLGECQEALAQVGR
jgi:hypothetical protein